MATKATETDLYALISQQVNEIIAHYKEKAKDGWTLSEVWQLMQSATASFMKLAESFNEYTGDEKKKAVLKAAELFYDQVIAPIDIPTIPSFLETTLVDPAIRKLFLKLTDGAIDALTNLFNRVGWYDVPAGTNGANGGTVPSTVPTASGFVPY